MPSIQSSRRCAGVAQANTQLEAAMADTKTWARAPSLKPTVEPA